MLLSEFGRGIAIAAVVFALLLDRPNLTLLIGAAVIEEILEVFSSLAERRYVGSLVQRDQVSSALVRMEARTHVVVLAGRPFPVHGHAYAALRRGHAVIRFLGEYPGQHQEQAVSVSSPFPGLSGPDGRQQPGPGSWRAALERHCRGTGLAPP
jgi:hypothetical protein